jgi:hypothetical protein
LSPPSGTSVASGKRIMRRGRHQILIQVGSGNQAMVIVLEKTIVTTRPAEKGFYPFLAKNNV